MSATTVRDIALGTDGDLSISRGDLVLVTGATAIVQAVAIELQFYQGEWFLDLSAGVPYFQEVLVKNPAVEVLQTVFRDVILSVPGVSALTSLNLTTVPQTRALQVAYTATTDVGLIGDTVEV